MQYNLQEYEDFICGVLKRIPILRTQQLILALKNYYTDVDDNFAELILYALQKRQRLMMSSAGWVMTKGYYLTITNDKFFDGCTLNEQYRFGDTVSIFGNKTVKGTLSWQKLKEDSIENLIDSKRKEIIDCMWIIVDLLPDSYNFVIGNSPWTLLFDYYNEKEEISKLYEITKIQAKTESTKAEIIRNLPPIKDKDFRETINRIAIIENENHAWKIPHLGFKHICVIDPEEECNFRIVETRNGEEIWSDYE